MLLAVIIVAYLSKISRANFTYKTENGQKLSCRVQEVTTAAMSIRFENRMLQESRFGHVESR